MASPGRGGDDNWLGAFVVGAVGESRSDGLEAEGHKVPPTWMELVDGPSFGKAIGPIGPYRIDRRIGRGGMGVVFQAFDLALLRHVAIKFLTPRLAVSPLARARFAREGQAAAAIKDVNVVTIHAIAEHEGLPYLVMEYVNGITLADRLEREGMLDRKSVLRIGLQVARGLAAAHAQGLVHRDVKPGNILLEGGLDQVKITDFGLACITTEPWRLTASGVLLGTPAYMSPEQASFSAVDHRSDLFSLGSVLYHLSTGELPFPGPTIKAVLAGVRESEPRPIRDLNPDISPALEDLVRRLMAKDPAERYPSASELAHTLAVELAEVQGRRPNPSPDDPEHESRWTRGPRGAPPGGALEMEDLLGDANLTPLAKEAAASATHASSSASIARRALPVIAVVMAVAIIALAMISYLPTWWRDFGEDAPSIFLVALAGLAVIAWSLAGLVTAVLRQGEARSSQRRRVGILRNLVATAILLPTAGTAYLELSTYAQFRRALSIVNARLVPWSDSAPPTRQEVETLLGRAPEDLPAGSVFGPIEVTYRWRGVFRSYTMRAKYRRLRYNMRDPRARPPDGEGGFDVLESIFATSSNVAEQKVGPAASSSTPPLERVAYHRAEPAAPALQVGEVPGSGPGVLPGMFGSEAIPSIARQFRLPGMTPEVFLPPGTGPLAVRDVGPANRSLRAWPPAIPRAR
jgi:serine/threonine protein kinase